MYNHHTEAISQLVEKTLNLIVFLPNLPLYFLEFSFILMKKEVHMSNQLLNKYAEIISSLKASNGIKVVSVEEINDNEAFLRLKDSFESYFVT